MSKTVAFPAPSAALSVVAPTRAVEPVSGAHPDSDQPPPRRQPQQQQADLRLVIEEDDVSGSFVYKVFDRRTGEVVQQFPREEVLRLKDDPAYAPGQVFDAQS